MAKRASRKKAAELEAQEDPRAPLDAAALLAAAQPVLKKLRADLAERAGASAAVTAALEARHGAEREARRTADGFAAWRERLLAQVAASWFLSCVFVRTLEDRGLLGRNRLAGPGATDSQSLFFSLAPSLTERDYLLAVFREMTRLPAARALFDPAHSLVWKLAPSAEVARELLGLFRLPAAEAPAFRFGQASTRFLGDLYQDLDEDVRKRFALLQTPDFVESFILDRTLEPAIEKFGLDDTTIIDPTCGSGHFLLGAFDRLFEHRLRAQPDLGERKAAELALGAVFGADINPYAVAIARFRLTLAYLEKAGYARLADAPELPLHVAVADSLVHNPHREQTELAHVEGASIAHWRLGDELFALEDESAARDVLHRQYAAVVGNPPYITEKDSAKRELYREMYPRSAGGKYALAAPFCERFFQLGRKRGFVGQITANSFMKREFGKKLIEDFLPSVNLETIVNTSGAYIPGHGTPTVLLFGTAEEPREPDLLTVLAKRGEPTTPADPAKGEVWSSIADHFSEVGFENDYISVARTERTKLAAHPWSLGGGGAVELKELLEERAEKRLGDIVEDIGFASFTGLDDAFILPARSAETLGIEPELIRPMVTGETIRDWSISTDEVAITPYDSDAHEGIPYDPSSKWGRYLWRFRAVANNVSSFGGKTRQDEGQNWWEWYRWQSERYMVPYRIAFAFVATHNHFVLDRGGKVFNRSAPIIKLPDTATEDDHLALLAYLNSSTACFWMKQVFFDKGAYSGTGKQQDDPAKVAYEFPGTQLAELPVPKMSETTRNTLVSLARRACQLAQQRETLFDDFLSADALAAAGVSSATARVREQDDALLSELVGVQEDIDWQVYEAFGITKQGAYHSGQASVAVQIGQRPFEVLQARGGRRTGLDGHALAESVDDERHAKLWEGRITAIQNDPALAQLEEEKHKRRWVVTPRDMGGDVLRFDDRVRDFLHRQLETSLESLISGSVAPQRRSDLVARVPDVTLAIARHMSGGADGEDLLTKVLHQSALPFVSAATYTASGLQTRAGWEALWSQQRLEDSGDAQESLSMPRRYYPRDFRENWYWTLRGKLDVPKERFISYPGCESDEDGEPVYGWAGWNHLERAQALATLYQKRRTEEGWTAERLTPMLAGLLELLPWVKQWHNDPDVSFGGLRMGDYYEQFLDAQLHELGLTRKDLTDWRPAKKIGRARPGRKKVAETAEEQSARPRRGRAKKAAGEPSLP